MSVQKTFQKLIELIKKRDEKLQGFLESLHPSDLAELVEDLNDQQKQEFFALLSDEDAAEIMQEMEEFDQVTLFRLLTRKRASAILKEMASDDAVDLLGELEDEESREILTLLKEEGADIRGLLQYPEDSAGGIMTTEFTSLPDTLDVIGAIKHLREMAPEAETIYYLYVVDDKKRLIGVVSLRELIAAQDNVSVKEIMQKNLISVHVDTDQEEVARVVARYDLLAVPVVDEGQHLLGIITVDDILDVVEEEATEDIYKLVGTSEVEGRDFLDATVFNVAGKRLPWLIISLLGGLVTGSVIGIFERTLREVIELAIFIPVIMGMGGNVGSQSSIVFVRGLATGEIGITEVWRYFFREVRIGFTIGLITGVMIAIAATLWQPVIPNLGVVVGIAMFITVITAAVIGTLVPMVFNRFGIDPAITAGPFVTTIKDVTGLLIYFLVANALMGIGDGVLKGFRLF
jgi:magnesium transporter